MNEFQKAYLESLRLEESRVLSENIELIESFIKYCQTKGISISKDNCKYIREIGIIVEYQNIVEILNNSLIRDKEGLIEVSVLDNLFYKRDLQEGYFIDNNYMLMAHPFLRRGLNSNRTFSYHFIKTFSNYSNENTDLHISLDYNRVKIDINYYPTKTKDYWFGAKFNKDISKIEESIVKLKPPSDIDSHIISSFFNDIHSLDISWVKKGSILVFQAIEFKRDKVTVEFNNNIYYPAKYVHAEYDTNKKIFRHFDGAIHLYKNDDYYRRRDSDFNFNKKNKNHIKAKSIKLFKMNGEVKVDDWVNFTSYFYTESPLIFEYFEGEYPNEIKDILTKVRNLERN
ncbi:MAG: hypothetical protein ACE364_09375 [Chlorobiota bacterium]